MTTGRRKHTPPQAPAQEQSGDQLCQAASQADLTALMQLLTNGADPNAPFSGHRWRALMLTQNPEIAQALLQAGADVHLQDEAGMDALDYALDLGNETLLYLLLQAGADLNRRDKVGWTRLRKAAFACDPERVALLLKLGADPALDRGRLLSAASWYGGAGYREGVEKTIDLLVAAGEDVHAPDHHGYTALHCAVLGYAHTPSDEHWWNASSDGSDETATRALLKHGADPNAAGNNGMTPLLLAVQSTWGAEPCIKALLAAGADVEKAGNGGITPLMRAAYHAQVEALQLLLTHRANITRKDQYGHTALHYAQQSLAILAAESEGKSAEVEEDQEAQTHLQEYLHTQQAKAKRAISLLEGSSAR